MTVPTKAQTRRSCCNTPRSYDGRVSLSLYKSDTVRILTLFLPLLFLLPPRLSPLPVPLESDGLDASTISLVKCGVVVVRARRPNTVKDVVGSGVIVSDRHVLTCCHVVRGAKTIHVVLINTKVLLGKVVLEEPSLDLAVVLVGVGELLYILQPSVVRVEPGATVFVVGHPFGYVYSVSKGIVSAVGREIEMPSGETLVNLIQIDAPVNPGNSGGPLLTKRGEWVGVVVALHKDAHGIAFALPVEAVHRILLKLQRL